MPAKKIIPAGTKFGSLTVIGPAGQDPKTSKSLSRCQCICGAIVVKRNNDLLTGRIVSCGCEKRKRSSKQMFMRAEKSNAYHMSGTPLYHCWRDMIRRCYDPKHASYKNYGDRGIHVCRRWRKSFKSFMKWALQAGFEQGLQIDRIDYNKGYYPSNCRFVTRIEQANNKSNNRLITYEGRTMTVAQWSRELGVPYHSLKKHTKRGGTLERYVNKAL